MAERFVETHVDKNWLYVATAQAFDDDMRDRLWTHQQRRSARWQTIEEPLDILPVLYQQAQPDTIILLDCLTLWLSNVLLADQNMDQAIEDLVLGLKSLRGPVVCVSNEVGLSIVPETKMGRDFRDAQGVLNQRVAARADHVVFVAAGLPLTLK